MSGWNYFNYYCKYSEKVLPFLVSDLTPIRECHKTCKNYL